MDPFERFRIRDLAHIDFARLSLFVSGIEVTQAVQYFDADQHLTDAADRGADNAVRLVAGKAAWARVYLGSVFGASISSATLEVQRRENGFLWRPVLTLNPTPPVLTSTPALTFSNYAATRGGLGNTLNFVIPASEMIGTLRLIAKVISPSRNVEYTTQVEVTLRQTLRLAGVMIAYNGPASMAPGAPNLTLAAPGLAALQAMSGTALTLFPVESTADFRTAGSFTLTHHLQDSVFPASGCGAGWDALHAQVANARTADGNQPGWIYYGLLPSGVPLGPVGGCGGGGVAVGPINQPGTLAHEAGHACGLDHAPAGGAPNADPNYPAYEPYDFPSTRQASIGEFGLNNNNGIIASPQTFRDFMAYGGPSWISLYHYGRLLSNATLNPVTVGIDHFWWKDLVWEEIRKWPLPIPDPPPFDFETELPVFPPDYQQHKVISLIVRVAAGKVVEVMHVARTRTRTKLDFAVATPFTARLRGAQAEMLAEAPLLRLETSASGCGCCGGERGTPRTHYLAQAFLPDSAPGAALEIAEESEVVWERKAPREPVRVSATKARLESNGKLRMQWNASPAALEYWVRCSRDGKIWHVLATGLTEPEASFESSRLPTGKILLEVVAHDGFHSAASKRLPVRIPERESTVAILHPVDGHTYLAGSVIHLWGSAVAANGDSIEPELCAWRLDKREIARGLDTWTTLVPGKHKITMRVAGKAGVAEASVTIKVVRPPMDTTTDKGQ